MPQLLGWWFLSSACSLTPNTIISKYRRQAVVSAKHVSFFKPSSWSLSSWKKHLVTITKAGKILTEKQPDTNPLRGDLKLTLRNTVKHIGLHKHTYSSRRSGGNLWASVHFTDTTCSVHTFLRHWYKTQVSQGESYRKSKGELGPRSIMYHFLVWQGHQASSRSTVLFFLFIKEAGSMTRADKEYTGNFYISPSHCQNPANRVTSLTPYVYRVPFEYYLASFSHTLRRRGKKANWWLSVLKAFSHRRSGPTMPSLCRSTGYDSCSSPPLSWKQPWHRPKWLDHTRPPVRRTANVCLQSVLSLKSKLLNCSVMAERRHPC